MHQVCGGQHLNTAPFTTAESKYIRSAADSTSNRSIDDRRAVIIHQVCGGKQLEQIH
jgi:hypothetical protein